MVAFNKKYLNDLSNTRIVNASIKDRIATPLKIFNGFIVETMFATINVPAKNPRLMAYKIDSSKCVKCGLCVSKCPAKPKAIIK